MTDKKEKGQALVEFALVISIFMTFLLVIIQLGIILGSQIVLNTAAKEGARLAAVGADTSDVEDKVLHFAALSPFIDINRSSISVVPDFRVWEDDVIVRINPAYVPIFLPFTGRSQYRLIAVSTATNFELGSNITEIDENSIGIREFKFNYNSIDDELYLVLEIEDFNKEPIDGADVVITIKEPGMEPYDHTGNTRDGGLYIKTWSSLSENDNYEATLIEITHTKYDDYNPEYKRTVSYFH